MILVPFYGMSWVGTNTHLYYILTTKTIGFLFWYVCVCKDILENEMLWFLMKLWTGLCFKDHVVRRCLWPSDWFYRNVVYIYILYREACRSGPILVVDPIHIIYAVNNTHFESCNVRVFPKKRPVCFCGTAMVSKDTSISVGWIKSPTRKNPSPVGESPPMHGARQRGAHESFLPSGGWYVSLMTGHDANQNRCNRTIQNSEKDQ